MLSACSLKVLSLLNYTVQSAFAYTLFYVGYNIVTHRIADHHPGRMLPRQRPGHAQASSYHPSSLPLAVPQCAGPARASEYTSLSIRASSWHHDGMISESALMTRITSHDTIM